MRYTKLFIQWVSNNSQHEQFKLIDKISLEAGAYKVEGPIAQKWSLALE